MQTTQQHSHHHSNSSSTNHVHHQQQQNTLSHVHHHATSHSPTSSGVVVSSGSSTRKFSSSSSNNNSSNQPSNNDKLSEHEINKLHKWKDNLEDDHYICPISHVLMRDPVILSESGITFDRESITQWLQTKNTCPITKKQLTTKNLIPNYSTKNLIHHAMKKNISKVKHFVEKRIAEKRGLSECMDVVRDFTNN
ncbi:hypothetical protein FDP41_007805 [Naegleria fowleri]|uniref:U-box domain-containing protein n=1 Tax=Naegleria fowleri TaxID=5763 RepID=A0A6A5CE87_NAEFO|nr:uncharacterized protein FDP41_007805 [Naegleria fowleri]KAF0983890.1 hypothetical protein FDP41_007805 [Naegleria fowleri]